MIHDEVGFFKKGVIMGVKQVGEPYEWAIDWQARSFSCDPLDVKPPVGYNHYRGVMDRGDVQVICMLAPSTQFPDAWTLDYFPEKSAIQFKGYGFVRPKGRMGTQQITRANALRPYAEKAMKDALAQAGWTKSDPDFTGVSRWYRWDKPYDLPAHIREVEETVRQHREASSFAITREGAAAMNGLIARYDKKLQRMYARLAQEKRAAK